MLTRNVRSGLVAQTKQCSLIPHLRSAGAQHLLLRKKLSPVGRTQAATLERLETSGRGIATSVDPMEHASSSFAPGRVLTVHSREQFEALGMLYPASVVVLMCKSSHCRPCKMFARKYSRIAEKLENVIFTEVIGDESMDTRGWMMDMQVRATPTFQIVRANHLLDTQTGTNEGKLTAAIIAQLLPSEVAALTLDAAITAAADS